MGVHVWCTAVFVLGAVGAAAGPLPQEDEDLAVIKHAVLVSQAPPSPPGSASRAPVRPEARWLHVRVVERSGGKRVSVNMPLDLVRVIGTVPIHYDCGTRSSHDRCTIRLSDILRTLEDGRQELVEIEADEATVRVWLE